MQALAAALLLLLALSMPAGAADRLTVVLDWFVNPDHAPLVVAREKGFFADEGLEVELVAPADPNDPPKLVAAKQPDIVEGEAHRRFGGLTGLRFNANVGILAHEKNAPQPIQVDAELSLGEQPLAPRDDDILLMAV